MRSIACSTNSKPTSARAPCCRLHAACFTRSGCSSSSRRSASTLPEEVGRAKLIAKDKDRVIREAQENAQAIVDEATTAHSQMVDQSEIVRQARGTAEIVLREAEERARKIRAGADAYAAQVLAEMEGRLSTALGSVRKGQEALTQQRGTAQVEPAPLAEAAAKTKRAAFDAQKDTAELTQVDARNSVEVTP